MYHCVYLSWPLKYKNELRGIARANVVTVCYDSQRLSFSERNVERVFIFAAFCFERNAFLLGENDFSLREHVMNQKLFDWHVFAMGNIPSDARIARVGLLNFFYDFGVVHSRAYTHVGLRHSRVIKRYFFLSFRVLPVVPLFCGHDNSMLLISCFVFGVE